MDDLPSSEIGGSEKEHDSLDRRLFLRSLGKWSGAAIAAVGFGGAWLASAPEANAGIWINRWGPRRGGWINRVPGLHRRQRPMLGFGSTGGVLGAADGSTDGVLVAADGLIDGVPAEVDGSTGGKRRTGCIGVSAEVYQPLRILPSALADTQGDLSFVAIVRSREELGRCLCDPLPGLKWLQVEGMLGDSDTWTEAAHSNSSVPLDLVLSDPSSEFSDLYKLVDACTVHDFRVTIPARPGLLKAVVVPSPSTTRSTYSGGAFRT